MKKSLVRGVRKSAHISRRVFSVGANYSERVENKAHRIINGMDNSIRLRDKVLFKKVYYNALSSITPIHPALPRAGRPGQVTLLVPSLQKSSFFGGTATALIFAALVAADTEMDLLIAETLKHGHPSKEALRDFFVENGVPVPNIKFADLSPRSYKNYGYIDLHPDDIFICSAWWDAYLIERLPLIKKFIYLIQDYEPIFYNNSDSYLLAESTYHSKRFVPVCNTELMMKFMSHKGYENIAKQGLYFEPALNIGKKIGLKQSTHKKKTLFIYGRPAVERNLFYTALDTIDQLFSERSLVPAEWECYMAGQDNISNILLDSGVEVQNLGKMSMDDYYKFAQGVDVAVSLMMAPHPSYPPLELASLGAAVVTTKYQTKENLSFYNKNLLACESDIESLKKGVVEAASLSREERARNAAGTNMADSWSEGLMPVVKATIKKL